MPSILFPCQRGLEEAIGSRARAFRDAAKMEARAQHGTEDLWGSKFSGSCEGWSQSHAWQRPPLTRSYHIAVLISRAHA